jgi:peptide chain release factor subunit 1
MYKNPPENGIVFFVGHVAKGGNQTTMVQEVVVPPEPVPAFLYRCDSGFFLEPLEGLGETKTQFGLIVIDRSEATLGMLKGATISTIKHMFSQVPSKHGKGGQSKRRFERLIEEAAHEWYKKVGSSATECFLGNNIEGILIGGPGATKDYFLSKEYLNHELNKIVIDTFDTGYTDETGLRELVTRGSTRLSEMQLIKEKKLMDEFMREVLSPKGKLATYGLKQVEMALGMGAVSHLLVSEGFEKMENIEEGTVKRLGEMAENSNSDVSIISTESEEGISLQKAFGGLAAILRYPIS